MSLRLPAPPLTSPRSLTFCDVSMFYCERGGGIRTYHRAKMDWFSRQSQHRYVLVAPGPRFRVTRHCETVTLIEVRGVPTGQGPDGYRVPVDAVGLFRVLAGLQADVVEASDPWISGPVALLARRRGRLRGLVTSFFHTDSLGAYILPWLQRRRLPVRLRRCAAEWASRAFWSVQSLYDLTLVSSPDLKARLESAGLRRVSLSPFGLDAEFLDGTPRQATAGRPVRLLYAARLQPEKGIDLVLDTLAGFVDPPDVELTIAGAGPFAERIARLGMPGVTFAGYVNERSKMRELFRTHDVLLSPSATETFGLTTLEAMASGLVVVGADAGGVGDLMRQAGSPYLFRAGDRADFLRGVCRAIADDRTGASLRARSVAERHGTWADAIARQTGLYVDMLERDYSRTRKAPTPVHATPSPNY